MPLTKMVFELAVNPDADRLGMDKRSEVNADKRKINSAFASYSSKDREKVLMRVQGMRHVGVDVFLDVLSLRAGQNWQDKVYEKITKTDMLFLFWSEHSSQSSNVENEWRFALNTRGIDFIHPVPLVDPGSVPPPQELSSLHFNDMFFLFVKK
jgi:hypothetical protein